MEAMKSNYNTDVESRDANDSPDTLPMIEKPIPGYIPDPFPPQSANAKTKTTSLEEETRYYPEHLPLRPGSPPSASPPTFKDFTRRFWAFSISSYNFIQTPSGAARARRLAMVTILLLRSGMSALSILSAVFRGRVDLIVIYSLLTVLGFWFTATCLAVIGDAEGDKKVKGVTVRRWHFDAFLGMLVVIHPVLILTWFFGLSGWGLELTSIALWLAILGVAWIAGWEPELPTYKHGWAT